MRQSGGEWEGWGARGEEGGVFQTLPLDIPDFFTHFLNLFLENVNEPDWMTWPVGGYKGIFFYF